MQPLFNLEIPMPDATKTDSHQDSLVSIQQAYDLIFEKLVSWTHQLIEHLPNFVLAIFICLLFVFISKVIARFTERMSSKVVHSKQIISLMTSIVKVIVITLGFFIALKILGLSGTVTSLLAGAGIVGLAIGFAFQDMTENFIAGIAMGIRKPFQIGDVIRCEDVFGTVQTINLRNTIVETFYGQHKIVPNKTLFRNTLTNYHVTRQRKIELEVGIPYSQDIQTATDVLTDAINRLDFVIKKDDTIVFGDTFGDSSINLKVWFWINYPGETEYITAKHKAFVTVKNALDEAGINIPFPIRTLDFAIEGGETLANQLYKVKAKSDITQDSHARAE